MFLWPIPEVQTESRTTPLFSVIYTRILHIMEVIGGLSFTIVNLVGDYCVEIIEDSPSKRVYRGYICLDSLKYSSFQRVEFCITLRWNCRLRKVRDLVFPNEALVTFGWSSTVDVDSNLKTKSFGCRLFRSLYGLPLVDVDLQPKNWTAPFLWGGEVPAFLSDDLHVAFMLKNEADSYASNDDGVLTLAVME